MLVSLAVHAVFLCEQPVGSTDVFPNHPRLAWIFNRVALAPHQKLLHGMQLVTNMKRSVHT